MGAGIIPVPVHFLQTTPIQFAGCFAYKADDWIAQGHKIHRYKTVLQPNQTYQHAEQATPADLRNARVDASHSIHTRLDLSSRDDQAMSAVPAPCASTAPKIPYRMDVRNTDGITPCPYLSGDAQAGGIVLNCEKSTRSHTRFVAEAWSIAGGSGCF